MRSKRVSIALGVLAVLLLAGWFIRESNRPRFPVEIRCDRVITRPQVAAGFRTALILAPDGTVWGWGENTGGLLGPINERGRWNVPRRLDVGSNWVSLAAGRTFAVGTKADGTLWGWTFNPFRGPINIGNYTNPPTQLAPGSNWVSVSAGAGHVLALRADGELWTWGQNDLGQLGSGITNSTAVPARMGDQHWLAVSTGWFVSMGVQSDGSLWQWGFTHVDIRGKFFSTIEPERVDDGTNWITAIATDNSYIVRKRDGSWWTGSWGWGSMGNGPGTTNRLFRFRLSDSEKWLAVAGGGSPLYGVKPDSTLWCGKNEWAGTQMGERADWERLWHSSETEFGLTRDGTLWTWGNILQERSSSGVVLGALRNWFVKNVLRRQPSTAPQSEANPWPLVHFTTNAVPAGP